MDSLATVAKNVACPKEMKGDAFVRELQVLNPRITDPNTLIGGTAVCFPQDCCS